MSFLYALILCVPVFSIQVRTSVHKTKPNATDKELIHLLLDEAVRRTEDLELDPEEKTKQYLIMIGALYVLSRESEKYKNMLGLTLFNYPASFRDPYFRMALKIFRKLPGVKAQLRAAYSAYWIKEFDLAREIFDNIKSDLQAAKMTKLEQQIAKRLLQELYKNR